MQTFEEKVAILSSLNKRKILRLRFQCFVEKTLLPQWSMANLVIQLKLTVFVLILKHDPAVPDPHLQNEYLFVLLDW